ncbi:MAG: TRAM domain-containing protein, partial [Gemmatimonadetes bacterium]|nr:TRAM domain-containing protein [Gemmatimonadota bacterium]
RVGGFTYSPEDGTRAAAMEDSVPASLKRERLEELMDVQPSISFERNLEQVGTVRRVLVDRRLDGADADPDFEAVGRTESQALDVDGATQLLPTEDGVLTPGHFVDVEIVDALEYDLIGKVVTT